MLKKLGIGSGLYGKSVLYLMVPNLTAMFYSLIISQIIYWARITYLFPCGSNFIKANGECNLRTVW
jgi:hypothetical protein